MTIATTQQLLLLHVHLVVGLCESPMSRDFLDQSLLRQ